MSGRTFVDTNVLVYAADTADPNKQDLARAALRVRAREIVLSTQVLAEFYVVVTRRLATPMTEPDAAEAVVQLARRPVIAINKELVADAIGIARDARISYWDAQIVAAARAAGCETILTEDLQAGATVAGTRIENPFV